MSDVIFSPEHASEQLRIVHLTSGEDIVGRVVYDEARSGYMVYNPVTPQVDVDTKMGTMRLGLLPIRPYYGADKVKEVFVSSLHAMYVSNLSEQMEEAYRQYHSRIVLPKLDSLPSLLS